MRITNHKNINVMEIETKNFETEDDENLFSINWEDIEDEEMDYENDWDDIENFFREDFENDDFEDDIF